MSRFICTVLLFFFCIPDVSAQRLRSRIITRPRPNALLVGGIVSTSVGGVCFVTGGLVAIIENNAAGYNNKNNHNTYNDNTGVVMMGIGAGLAIGGTIMIVAGARQMHKNRWSVIAPKGNELGVAYNLLSR